MKKLLLLITLPFIIAVATPAVANASSPTAQACGGLSQLYPHACSKTTTSSRVTDLVKTVINILSLIIGIVSVIVIIIAGFRFITAGGDSNTISSARDQLLYAVVGVIVAAIAQVISRFALHTGSNVNNFVNKKGGIIYFPHMLSALQVHLAHLFSLI